MWDLVVGDGYGDGDTGVSKGLEDVRIGVEEADAVNDGGMEEKLRYLMRRREVVS